jgi:hypothetical protein
MWPTRVRGVEDGLELVKVDLARSIAVTDAEEAQRLGVRHIQLQRAQHLAEFWKGMMR